MIKSTHILLYNSKKEILLQLRDNKPGIWYPGQWGLLGGRIEETEIPKQGLIRELKEELPGCNIEDITFIISLRKMQYLLYMFKGKINEDETRLNKKLKEGQCVKYFKIGKIKDLKVPAIFKEFIFKHKNKIFI